MYEVTDEELTVLTNLTELGSAGSQPLFPDFNLLPDSWNQAEFINGESCDTGFQFLAFLTCPDYSSEDSGIYNMADSTSIDQNFPQFTELLDAVTTHSKNSDQPVLQERRVCGEQDKETNISKVKSFQGNRKERNRKRGKGSIASHSVHLWEFVRDLLLSPQKDQNVVRWEDRKEGTFRVVCSEMFARLWGEKKQNKCMNYEKLSRALRHYYKSGILERVDRRLTYKFGEKAYGWKEDLAL